jgi:cyclic dehypoxanthinyl futalosine synthase
MQPSLEDKIAGGGRITDDECLALFGCELGTLGRLASACRQRHNPGDTVTFVVDININLTNVCTCECAFCAFYVKPDSPRAFVLSAEQVFGKIAGLIEIGGTQVMLQGGINPSLGIDYYVDLLRAIRKRFKVYVHALSPAEIWGLSRKEGIGVEEVLRQLRDAGLDSLPGGGAEILVDMVRQETSPGKVSAQEWLNIMRTAHGMGMKSTATMMFGGVETLSDRVEHLSAIRRLQDETGGFRAFIPWTFCPGNTRMSHLIPVGGGEYLKTLAISRIYLDNIQHVGSGWLTEGMRVAQLGLAFGADDMGGVLLEEKVLEATGLVNATGIAEMKGTIAGAGFIPAQRDTEYRIVKEFR